MMTLKEQKQNKCKHYNGTINDRCDAGVAYADVRVSRGEGKGFDFPCLLDRCDGTSCDKREFYSEAEIDAQIEETNRRFEGTMLARQAIVAHLGGAWKKGMPSKRGVIDCPVCGAKDKLHFSRAGYNGHIHAQCETADCVAWME